jgi:superoxide dismutase, Cu-Zn family
MRSALLIALFAVACATSSSSTQPSGGATTTAADAGSPAAAGASDAGAPISEADAGAPSQPVALATARLEPRSGSNISGDARITPSASGVVVMVEVQNATPGEHGVHIHDKGDCSDPAAQSAGPHYNPKSSHHGGVSTPVRHAGDLGNMQVDSNGRGLLVVSISDVSINDLIGRSVVVHEKKDDLQTDPAGNSGARFACGPIQ